MKDKRFGNFRVSGKGRYVSLDYFCGWCALDCGDVEDLRKALEEYDKRSKKIGRKE